MITILSLMILGAFAHDKPVIGIFTIPSDVSQYSKDEYSYIAASYVKQIESAGAMVVPISWEASYSELEWLIDHVNGVLFTGGDSDIYLNETSPGYSYNKLTDAASFIVMKAILQNRAGRFLPVMGTCQGFQLIQYIISQYYPVLSAVTDDVGVERLLNITDPVSDMFIEMPTTMIKYLTTTNGPYYSHHWGILPETYAKAQSLSAFFKITSLSKDGANLTYIASAEGNNYPFYLFQFHPEKHSYEWQSKADHDPVHISMSQYFANLFVQYSRQSENIFPEDELYKRIIYNYTPVNLAGTSSSFVQVYIFPRDKVIELKQEKLGIKFFQKRKQNSFLPKQP